MKVVSVENWENVILLQDEYELLHNIIEKVMKMYGVQKIVL